MVAIYVKDIPVDKLEDCIWESVINLLITFTVDGAFNEINVINKDSQDWFKRELNKIKLDKSLAFKNYWTDYIPLANKNEKEQRTLSKQFIECIQNLRAGCLIDALHRGSTGTGYIRLEALIGELWNVSYLE